MSNYIEGYKLVTNPSQFISVDEMAKREAEMRHQTREYNKTLYFKQNGDGNVVENFPFPSCVSPELKDNIKQRYISYFNIPNNDTIGYTYNGVSFFENDVFSNIMSFVSDSELGDLFETTLLNCSTFYPESSLSDLFLAMLNELQASKRVVSISVNKDIKNCILKAVSNMSWYSEFSNYENIFSILKDKKAFIKFVGDLEMREIKPVLRFFQKSAFDIFSSLTIEDYEEFKPQMRKIFTTYSHWQYREAFSPIIFTFIKDLSENEDVLMKLDAEIKEVEGRYTSPFSAFNEHYVQTECLEENNVSYFPDTQDFMNAFMKVEGDGYGFRRASSLCVLIEAKRTTEKTPEQMKLLVTHIKNGGNAWSVLSNNLSRLQFKARDFLPYL